jgi:FkbM family methyltransferase
VNLIFILLLIILLIDITLRLNHDNLKIKSKYPATPIEHWLELPPHVTTIFLNLGSNVDPILPPEKYFENSLTLAFEPLVSCQIRPHPLLRVIPSAISTKAGITTMYFYNHKGESSSLSRVLPSHQSFWNSGRKEDGQAFIVPTVSLNHILDALPPSIVRIPYMKTDLQGYDWAVISNAKDALIRRPIDYLYTEVHFDRETSYEGVHNDFCRDWWPSMNQLGYDLVYVERPGGYGNSSDYRLTPSIASIMCSPQKISTRKPSFSLLDLFPKEGNALWKHKGALNEEFNFTELPK